MDIDCEMMNSIELTSKRVAKNVDNTYLKIVNNAPLIFKNIYRLGQLYCKLPIKSPVYGFNKFFCKKAN
jgi:hypothetical protein